MHESAPTFVPAATSGQPIPKCPTPRHGRCNCQREVQADARSFAEKSRALAKLAGEALQVEKREAGGGLICGEGKNSGNTTVTDAFSVQAAPAANVWRTIRLALRAETISANACRRGF
jgi:hypothetical protein